MHGRNQSYAMAMPSMDSRPMVPNTFGNRRGSMPLIDNAKMVLSSKMPQTIIPGSQMARDHGTVSNYINVLNNSPLRTKSRNYHLPAINTNNNGSMARNGSGLGLGLSPEPKILNRRASVLESKPNYKSLMGSN